jgi:hypothetical protein
MSQAIAQSATQLSVSNAVSDWNDEQFYASAKRCSERQAKGATRERNLLRRNGNGGLISMVCADYRSHFTALYGKTDRLPSEVFQKIEAQVDKYLASKLGEVNSLNAISYRRSFYHNFKDFEVTERVNVTGENMLSLKEQHLGIVIFITQAEKRLKDLEAKLTPDLDREKEVKAQIMRLNTTRNFIEGEMKHQEELKKPVNQTK